MGTLLSAVAAHRVPCWEAPEDGWAEDRGQGREMDVNDSSDWRPLRLSEPEMEAERRLPWVRVCNGVSVSFWKEEKAWGWVMVMGHAV